MKVENYAYNASNASSNPTISNWTNSIELESDNTRRNSRENGIGGPSDVAQQ